MDGEDQENMALSPIPSGSVEDRKAGGRDGGVRAADISMAHLRRKDTAFRMMLDCLFDGVYIVNRARKIIFWNRGAEEITGFSADEVAGRMCSDNILNHIDEDGTPLCQCGCPLSRTLSTGQSCRAKIYPRHKSQRRFPVMTHIAPIKDREGKTIAAIEVFRDISTEEDFRVLQEKFRGLISRYVSLATLEEILARVHSGAESQARKRDLTISFLDIAKFTSFSEKHSPEEAVEMVNEVFGICEVITEEFNGDIDKFIGDSVMAVFADANDAVLAGDRILRGALPRLNEIRAKAGLEAIQLRIGINSGLVIQGDIGTEGRKDLTVMGDVVNTAARIEQECRMNSMLISEATWSRLKNPDWFRLDRQVLLKGKKQPISLFKYARK